MSNDSFSLDMFGNTALSSGLGFGLGMNEEFAPNRPRLKTQAPRLKRLSSRYRLSRRNYRRLARWAIVPISISMTMIATFRKAGRSAPGSMSPPSSPPTRSRSSIFR